MSDRFLRSQQVIDLTGVPRASRYEMINRGEFPRPVKLGKIAAWSEREITDWQKRCIAKRDRKTA